MKTQNCPICTKDSKRVFAGYRCSVHGVFGVSRKEIEKFKKRHSGFERGSGCFVCLSCGKKTRDVNGNSQFELCVRCVNMFEEENAELDKS